MPTPPPPPPRGSLRFKLYTGVTSLNTIVYRLTGGRLGGRFGGAPLLLLHHVGRKTGERRTTPLLYLEDGADLVLVASFGGAPRHPVWYLNLKATPRAEVQLGTTTRPVTARDATEEERARLWPRLVAMYPDYDVYRSRTDRQIPVVILEPA